MKIQDSIVQFVCYETSMNTEEFVVQWERFTKRFANKDTELTLQESVIQKNKFKFVSRNVWPEDSFQFVFMEGRLSHNFPEGHVKVIEAGGYTPVQVECSRAKGDMIKVLVFTKNPQADRQTFKDVAGYKHLNIYEAYYESCKFVYIFEYFVKESALGTFKRDLDLHSHLTDIGIYKEYAMVAV